MKALCTAVAMTMLAAAHAPAASVQDATPWAAEFRAALANDPEAMLTKANEVLVAGFLADALRDVLAKVDGVIGTQPWDHAKHFHERSVSSFLNRIDVAEYDAGTHPSYSPTSLHGASGWQFAQNDCETITTETLGLTWPE